MAAVFKAMHIRFEELRALKVISADLASDPAFVKRLQQEAVVTRRLQHPNAVRVEDIDEAEDGRPFIVMEFIEGRSLKDLIEESAPLPVGRTLPIIKQAASALDAAHALGILHRDIKPANIVLVQTPEGEQAKVLDFGIAKVKEANLGETADMTLTGQGRVVGTSAYMSPEQAMGMRGDELDGRSDLYSLGVVMYQMLVGELPLKAESEVTMLMAHIQLPPRPISELRPDIPQPVADLVMTLLSKNRELRPKSGRALIAEIERCERAEQVAEPAAEPEETVLYQEAYHEPLPAPSAAPPSRSYPAPSPVQPAVRQDAPGAPVEPPPAAGQPVEEATMLASGFEMPGPGAPPAPAPSEGQEFAEAGATMLVSGLGAALEPGSPPPAPPESYPPAEPTMLASSFEMKPRGESSSPPPAPYPAAERTMLSSSFEMAPHGESPAASPAAFPEPYPGGEATTLAGGFGAPAEPPSPDAYSSGTGTDAYPKSEATSLASEFGAIPPPPPGPAGPDAYPGGEATMLASGLGSAGEGAYHHSPYPPSGPPAEDAPAFPGLSPEASAVGLPKADAPWGTPAPSSGWETPPAPVQQAPQTAQVAPPAAPRKSSSWMIWAAVPVVAAVLTLGAWFFLSQTNQPGGGNPSSPPPKAQPSAAPPATSPATSPTAGTPANGGAQPQQPPPEATPAAGGESGGQPKAAETKPAETKPEEAKPVDQKALRTLKAQGDAAFDKGSYDEAIRDYREALKLDPKNGALTQQIARVKKAQETEKALLH